MNQELSFFRVSLNSSFTTAYNFASYGFWHISVFVLAESLETSAEEEADEVDTSSSFSCSIAGQAGTMSELSSSQTSIEDDFTENSGNFR